MSSEEPRSPTFDGNETAEQTGTVADVSGIPADGQTDSAQSPRSGEQVERPNEAAQIVP